MTGMPKARIVASTAVSDEASKAKDLGADIVEIRMDLVAGDPLDALGAARRSSGLPIIATNRMRSEGGRFPLSEAERMDLLIDASAYADFLDIELRAEGRRWLMNKIDLPAIVSYHDFRGTPGPDGLRSILAEISKTGALIAKIAVTPQCMRDCLDLLELLIDAKMPLCVIAMGEIGRHLRAVASLYGSALTYGYISKPTAPGQMSVPQLKWAIEMLEPSSEAED
jgi:3-dehydroquinate dehydratase-1